jgi:hypothetical protein
MAEDLGIALISMLLYTQQKIPIIRNEAIVVDLGVAAQDINLTK